MQQPARYEDTGIHHMVGAQPAVRWQDAFPTGNGSVGALVYGQICSELVVLNHDRLRFPSPSPSVPDVTDALATVRSQLADGKYNEAAGTMAEALNDHGYAHRVAAYHPACDLELLEPSQAAFSEYRRTLDFSTGEVGVRWNEGDVTRRRRLFVSRADDVVVMQVSTSSGHTVSGSVALIPHDRRRVSGMGSGKDRSVSSLPLEFHTECEGPWSRLVGTYTEGEPGNEFGAVARVEQVGGTRETDEAIAIRDAEEIVVLIKLFTEEDATRAIPGLTEELAGLPAEYEQLLARHLDSHRELYRRSRIEISAAEEADRDNERMLLDAYSGDVSTDLLLRLCNFGRYLLITSSAPGGLPANLQGVWNGDYDPAWASDYHNDENIQMNYWSALPGNLPEATLPYFDYYDRCLADFRENARAVYGCRGILAPVSQSTDGKLHPGIWINWTAGAGWLASLYYDYWLFTGDEEFLRDRAIPFLKEVALFYEDFLVEGRDGRLQFAPSLSPENVPARSEASMVTINATMDVAVAREVLANLCEACEHLDVESEGRARWRSIIEKLPEYEVNDDGALKEWLHPDLPDHYVHRHLSHLYPLFPGIELSAEETPRLFEACRVAVEKRLVVGRRGQTGWSYAHMASIYARLGNGDRALECLELIARSCVGPNLFSYHNDWRGQGLTMFWGHGAQPPFQIDANLGLTAAIIEMLLASVPGTIRLLPALPSRWMRGSFAGLCCRGGVEVDASWDLEQRIVSCKLRSRTAQTVRVLYPRELASLRLIDGSSETPVAHRSDNARGADVRLEAGRRATLRAEFSV